MAANESKPGDFLSGSTEDKLSWQLLPPSEFEKPVTRDVDRATHRHQVHSKCHVEWPDTGIMLYGLTRVAPPCAHPKKDYVDELIQRQAGEIVELRSEVMKIHLAYEQDTADWKARLSLLEEEHAAEVRRLEKNLASVEEERDIKLCRLQGELERTSTDKQMQTSALQEKLESTRLLLETRVHDLEEELRSLQHDSDSSRRQLEAELRQKSQQLEEQSQQICCLKSYICDTEETRKPALAWKMEKEAVDNKLKIAEAENHKLTSTIELMEVRFQALKEILSIQEQKLDKARVGVTGKAKQASLLLTCWREKVFSLLVRQLMSDILHKGDIQGLQQKIHSLEDQLSASQAQVQVQQHSLADKLAQLQIELNKNQRLQEECENTHQVAVCLDDQSKRDYHSVELLAEFVHEMKKQMDKTIEMMEQKSTDLKKCDQRVSFATNRMEFIKTQLARKWALAGGVARGTENLLPVSPGDRGDSRDSDKLVYQELEQLTQERDTLAAQLRADTEHWSVTVAEIRAQLTKEVSSVKENMAVLEQQLQLKLQECRELAEEVDNLKEDVQEKDNRIKQLQAELSRHERGIEHVLTEQRLQDELHWREQLTDLERKLNAAKREQAKAVVSLRQMEQSHQRRLQQAEDLLQTTEQHLRRQIEQLEARLRSVEKERNLMMATLRQEGLLSQLRSDRGHLIHLHDEEENCNRNQNQDDGGDSHGGPSGQADVPMMAGFTDSSCATVKPGFLHGMRGMLVC
ncbi:unnamed protein product [Candidula unifasciata]|uniref:Coiled-coil alpha-helical rod protein 1 n=1 Tax=Candidula unifasciata TaxID=100452 RepID=A0A8S3Z6Y9_9EUPU|nr:unnamed protein product [Candidula unifasciata]